MQTAKIDLDDGGERELVLHLLRFSEVYNMCNGETEMFIAIAMFAFHLCLFGRCNVWTCFFFHRNFQVVEEACTNLLPNVLCEYLYNLSEIFTKKFYSNYKVSTPWFVFVLCMRFDLHAITKNLLKLGNLVGGWISRGSQQTLALWSNSHCDAKMLLSTWNCSRIQNIIVYNIKLHI